MLNNPAIKNTAFAFTRDEIFPALIGTSPVILSGLFNNSLVTEQFQRKKQQDEEECNIHTKNSSHTSTTNTNWDSLDVILQKHCKKNYQQFSDRKKALHNLRACLQSFLLEHNNAKDDDHNAEDNAASFATINTENSIVATVRNKKRIKMSEPSCMSCSHHYTSGTPTQESKKSRLV